MYIYIFVYIYILWSSVATPPPTVPHPHHATGGDIQTYIHTYIHTNIQTYIHTYIHHTQTNIQTFHTHTHKHTYTHYIHECMHTYIYIYIPTYLHPYITFHSIPLHYIPYQTIYTYHTSSTSQTPHHHRPQGGITRSKTEHPSPLGGWPTRNHIYMYMYTFPWSGTILRNKSWQDHDEPQSYPVCTASAANNTFVEPQRHPAEIAWPAVEQLGLPRCGEEVATRWPQTCLPFSNGMLFCTRSCNHFISTSYFGSNLSGISLIHPCFVYLWLLPVGFKKTTAW